MNIAIHVPWISVCTCAARMATRPTAQVLPHRRRALRLPRRLRRRVPRRWRAGLHQHPKVRRQIGVRTAWAKTRQILFAWWVWAVIAITALVYDKWGWAIGTGLMSAFSFLAWPREVPPRVGLEHEFACRRRRISHDDCGIDRHSFFRGKCDQDSQQRRRVLSRDVEGDRTAHSARSPSRRTSTGRAISESGLLRRSRRAPKAGIGVKILLDAVGSSTIGDEILEILEQGGCQLAWYNPAQVCTASDDSTIGRTASRSSSMAASPSPEARASPITGWGTRRTASTGAIFRFGLKARPSCRSRPGSLRTGCRRPAK